MTARRCTAWTLPLVVVAQAACSDGTEPTAPDAGTVDAQATDAQVTTLPDAGRVDSGVHDAGFETLPLGPGDVLSVSDADEIEIYTVGFVDGDNAQLFIERYDEPFTTGQLFRVDTNGRTFSTATLVDTGPAKLTGSPSAVRDYLYTAHSERIQGAASLARRRFDGTSFSAPEEIVSLPVSSLLAWPQFIPLADGGVVVAYRDGQSRPNFASSSDGLVFGAPVLVHQEPGAIPTVAEMDDGVLVFTHQRPVGNEPMVSFWQLSHDDGATWTAPARVTTSSPNVHDTTVVRRRDGAADLYYIHPQGPSGFVLFRRSLDSSGTLGPEEQVTALDVVEPSKPRGVRLTDGALLLTYAEISQRSQQGFPTIQRTKALLLRTEAPR